MYLLFDLSLIHICKEGQEFYKYERLILKMVVLYGERVMCNVTNEEGQETPITCLLYTSKTDI